MDSQPTTLTERHFQGNRTSLPSDFRRPSGKIPLYAGRLHFIRRIDPDGTVSVLNVKWAVPQPDFSRGVWVTLELQPEGATLFIFDQPPDVPTRKQLATHPFPLSEPVLLHTEAQKPKSPPSDAGRTQEGPTHQTRLTHALRSPLRHIHRLLSETIYWRMTVTFMALVTKDHKIWRGEAARL